MHLFIELHLINIIKHVFVTVSLVLRFLSSKWLK